MKLNKFIKTLAAEKGYKYAIKASDTEVIMTKARMKKDGTFPDSSVWDTWELDEGESLPKGMKVGEIVNVVE